MCIYIYIFQISNTHILYFTYIYINITLGINPPYNPSGFKKRMQKRPNSFALWLCSNLAQRLNKFFFSHQC